MMFEEETLKKKDPKQKHDTTKAGSLVKCSHIDMLCCIRATNKKSAKLLEPQL